MKSILLIGSIIALALNSKKPSKKSSTKPAEKPISHPNGYDMVFPCQTFEIFDEEKTYKFGYNTFKKLLDEQLEGTALNDLLAAYSNIVFGCALTSPFYVPGMFENTPVLNPTYYTWGYRMIRAGLKAYSDLHHNTSEVMAICDGILDTILEAGSKNGLVMAGLPTSVYGDLIL